ncbi:hypothetical protein KY340_01485 [Candidatus Woesearchaeota archaeon]|nr:hypothetical protein [Candidatus Woesearchaeota archaeon]
MMNKRGQGLSLSVIIIAILAILVLVVLAVIFTGKTGQITTKIEKGCIENGGQCINLDEQGYAACDDPDLGMTDIGGMGYTCANPDVYSCCATDAIVASLKSRG